MTLAGSLRHLQPAEHDEHLRRTPSIPLCMEMIIVDSWFLGPCKIAVRRRAAPAKALDASSEREAS